MRALCLGLCLLLATSSAAADEIAPPPTDCARGAVGWSEPAGQWCMATECDGADACAPGELGFPSEAHVCSVRAIALCEREETYVPFSRRRTEEVENRTRRIAQGPCLDGACPSGGTCRTVRRCVPQGSEVPVPVEAERQTGWCTVGFGSSSGMSSLFVVLLGLLWRRRTVRR